MQHLDETNYKLKLAFFTIAQVAEAFYFASENAIGFMLSLVANGYLSSRAYVAYAEHTYQYSLVQDGWVGDIDADAWPRELSEATLCFALRGGDYAAVDVTDVRIHDSINLIFAKKMNVQIVPLEQWLDAYQAQYAEAFIDEAAMSIVVDVTDREEDNIAELFSDLQQLQHFEQWLGEMYRLGELSVEVNFVREDVTLTLKRPMIRPVSIHQGTEHKFVAPSASGEVELKDDGKQHGDEMGEARPSIIIDLDALSQTKNPAITKENTDEFSIVLEEEASEPLSVLKVYTPVQKTGNVGDLQALTRLNTELSRCCCVGEMFKAIGHFIYGKYEQVLVAVPSEDEGALLISHYRDGKIQKLSSKLERHDMSALYTAKRSPGTCRICEISPRLRLSLCAALGYEVPHQTLILAALPYCERTVAYILVFDEDLDEATEWWAVLMRIVSQALNHYPETRKRCISVWQPV